MLAGLSENRSLWIAFVTTLLITIAFPITSAMWGISFVDAMYDPAEVRQTISLMSPEQLVAHAWITATLDVAYPLAYGALFIGSTHRFYARFGRLIALPFFVLIPTDLLEGVVQVLALTNTADLIDAKLVLTPLKFLLFLFGIITTLIGWLFWLAAKIRKE